MRDTVYTLNDQQAPRKQLLLERIDKLATVEGSTATK